MTLARQRVGKNGMALQDAGLPPFNSGAIVQDAGDALIVDEFKLLHEDAEGNLKSLDFPVQAGCHQGITGT